MPDSGAPKVNAGGSAASAKLCRIHGSAASLAAMASQCGPTLCQALAAALLTTANSSAVSHVSGSRLASTSAPLHVLLRGPVRVLALDDDGAEDVTAHCPEYIVPDALEGLIAQELV